jgi:adenylate kinase family enzyme
MSMEIKLLVLPEFIYDLAIVLSDIDEINIHIEEVELAIPSEEKSHSMYCIEYPETLPLVISITSLFTSLTSLTSVILNYNLKKLTTAKHNSIESIEIKGKKIVLSQFVTSQEIENLIKEMLQEQDQKYKFILESKSTEISLYRQQNAELSEIAKLQALKPISVENKTMIEQSKNVEVEMNFHAPVHGATGENKGTINIYTSVQQQTLAEAAAEIKRLLEQLEETNPSATDSEQVNYVNSATKLDLKQRVISALKAGGESAVDEFFLENKYLKVGKAVIKGWLHQSS